MDTAISIAAITTPIIIALGFYFAYRQLQATRNTRIAQLVVMLMEFWNSPEVSEARRKINECGKKLKQTYEAADKADQIEAYGSLIRVANFFDGLGVLVVEGYVNLDVAYDMYGKAEKTYCSLYEPLITAREYEGYLPYFIKLHDLFVKEEARRSQAKKRRAS
jgi:hypothetical protein